MSFLTSPLELSMPLALWAVFALLASIGVFVIVGIIWVLCITNKQDIFPSEHDKHHKP